MEEESFLRISFTVSKDTRNHVPSAVYITCSTSNSVPFGIVAPSGIDKEGAFLKSTNNHSSMEIRASLIATNEAFVFEGVIMVFVGWVLKSSIITNCYPTPLAYWKYFDDVEYWSVPTYEQLHPYASFLVIHIASMVALMPTNKTEKQKNTCLAVYRFSGSTINNFEMKSFAASLTWSHSGEGKSNLPRRIWRYMVTSLSEENGGYPQRL